MINTGNTLNLANGLHLCVDWLSWTNVEISTVSAVIKMMGYSPEDFHSLPNGANGYRSQIRHCIHPISIQYDGNSNMGIHVDVSGSAINDLLEHFQKTKIRKSAFGDLAYETDSFDTTVFRDLLVEISKTGHVTRLDLAVDDIGANYYTLSELHNIFTTGSFSSRFRSWKELVNHRNFNIIGHTIYLGSRTSSIMLRIYDKQLEQNEKHVPTGESPIETPWVRWELELKKERAQQAVSLIIQGFGISNLTMGLLSNYLRLIDNDSTRKSRCMSMEKWDAFIDGISNVKLYCPVPPKTLDSTRKWLLRQVAPSLAAVVLAEDRLTIDGSIEYLQGLVENGTFRLRKYQRELINNETGASL